MVDDMDKKNLRLLDISNINCWMVKLKPGEIANDYEFLKDFQDACVKCNIFGIGWKSEINISKDYTNTAIDNLSEVKIGNILIMRNINAHYYVGRVSKEKFFEDNVIYNRLKEEKYINEKYNILSGIVEVEKWFEIKLEDELPMEICGRFSQRFQSTITRFANYRQSLLVIAAYERVSNNLILDKGVPIITLYL